MRRWFSKRQRLILKLLSGGKCRICGRALKANFHADHIKPFSRGGKTITANGQALCPECNLLKGNKFMAIKLRDWQTDALQKALTWLLDNRADRHFVINAAPGAGKTIAACAIAEELIERGEIDRVITIAPRAEVVNQWASSFKQVTGRYMTKVTGIDGSIEPFGGTYC